MESRDQGVTERGDAFIGKAVKILNTLTREHGIGYVEEHDFKSRLMAGMYTEKDEEGLKRELIKKRGIEIVGPFGPAACVPAKKDNGVATDWIVWLNLNYPALAEFNMGLATPNAYIGLSMVAEEISHWLYNKHYQRVHGVGSEPQPWMVEMIGALDKYTVLSRFFGTRADDADSEIFRGYEGARQGDSHHLGHAMAVRVKEHLNSLEIDEANGLERDLYDADETRMTRILLDSMQIRFQNAPTKTGRWY